MAKTDIEKTKEIGQKAVKEAAESKKKAKTSIVPNKVGQTETFHILKGKDNAWDLTLRFPGTAVGSTIIQNANLMIEGVSPNYSLLLDEAINNDMIVNPSDLVSSRISYFDSHDGFLETTADIASFLTDKLL